MRLMLAPMEGLVDAALRAALARIGGYDCAVSEFVRVSASCLPAHVFRRMVPELEHGSCTHGMPVRVQLLGADPGVLADNAAVLASLRPAAVDLNFGCPAPTVNRHGGGAVLLDDPERLYAIACAVRAVLPSALMLTAKMRLGVSDTARALDCAQALVAGGVAELVVHARTRDEAYRPPAHWEWVGRIGEAVQVPVIANGEVWTVADWARCRVVSGVGDVMLARGAVVDPFLARRIRAPGEHYGDDEALRATEWRELCPVLAGFRDQVMLRGKPGQAAGRIKQWLNLLRRRYTGAELVYQRIRPLTAMAAINEVFAAAGVVAVTGRVS